VDVGGDKAGLAPHGVFGGAVEEVDKLLLLGRFDGEDVDERHDVRGGHGRILRRENERHGTELPVFASKGSEYIRIT
jgi:hypothetical protein